MGESDLHACDLPASFSIYLDSSAFTPAGSVHKSSGDNVVPGASFDAVEEMMCVVCVNVTEGT